MKNILITGATGFLGKNLKELFLSSSVLTPTRSELNLLDIENVKRYLRDLILIWLGLKQNYLKIAL